MPTNIEHINGLDRENNNTLWRDALEKDMTKIGIAFEVSTEVHPAPPTWSKVTVHLVLDLKWTLQLKQGWYLMDTKILTELVICTQVSHQETSCNLRSPILLQMGLMFLPPTS